MADNDFFAPDQQPVEETTEIPVEKIKIGEREFTQEELDRRIGLSDIALEAEEKYKTKIDRVWPNFQSIVNEKRQVEEKLKTYEERLLNAVPQNPANGQPVLTEEIRRQALEQAEQLGIGPKAMENVMRGIVREEYAARELISSVDGLLEEAKSEGKPQTTSNELLQYMADNGIKNPSIAYEIMFGSELKKLDEQKLNTLRHPGMVSTTQSVGMKQPPRVSVTRANLKQLVEEELSRGSS